MDLWVRSFAENQPITVMVNGVRTLTEGSAAQALVHHDARLLRLDLTGVDGRHHRRLRPPCRGPIQQAVTASNHSSRAERAGAELDPARGRGTLATVNLSTDPGCTPP